MGGCLLWGGSLARLVSAGAHVGFRFTLLWRRFESTRRAGAQRSRERRALARRVKRRATKILPMALSGICVIDPRRTHGRELRVICGDL